MINTNEIIIIILFIISLIVNIILIKHEIPLLYFKYQYTHKIKKCIMNMTLTILNISSTLEIYEKEIDSIFNSDISDSNKIIKIKYIKHKISILKIWFKKAYEFSNILYKLNKNGISSIQDKESIEEIEIFVNKYNRFKIKNVFIKKNTFNFKVSKTNLSRNLK